MRWTPGGRSSNIEDRRGQSIGGGGFGRAGMGIGGTLILLVLSLIFGRDFIGGSGGGGGGYEPGGPASTQSSGGEVAPVNQTPAEDSLVQFVSFVLDNAQDGWEQILPKQAGTQYHDAKLVLFRDAVESGCGVAQSAMGPFYCPMDEKLYIDLGFYDELARRFAAPGDFAQAYVLAHEIGHHVQHLVGTDARVREMQERRPDAANALSVRLELQADCYAGVWGSTVRDQRVLQPGDLEEGIAAAAAVGDDRIQRQSMGGVRPESFTHGSSAQRMQWFRRGYDSGRMDACDTFVQ